MRTSEAHLQTVVDNLDEGVVVSDLKGELLHWNRAALKIHGIASLAEGRRGLSELVDTFELSTMDETPIPVEQWPLSRILRCENLRDLEVRVKNIKAHWQRVFSYSGTLVHDADNQPTLAIVTINDITERKQAEELVRASEERYRALFESNPSPMWIYDLETLSFLAVNAAAVKHYGYSQGEFQAMTIKDIRPPEDVPILVQDVEQTNADLASSQHWQHCKKNGALIDVEITSHELLWLGRRARVVLVNDITERKRAEETAQRLQKVEEEQRLAVEAARVKNDFLATMSHELRTPLNSVIGFTGTMLMGLPGPITPAQKKQLETIKASARHQLSLINDLLDLAKIESGKVELRLEPVACEEVVRAVAETLRPVAENKGLAFYVDLPAETRIAHAEKRALRQILINLVNNAIKFTEQGEVRIELRNGDKKTRIAVTDTGSGITEEDRPKLFKAFSRLEHTNAHREEGTGLGLHLSQKLAELMGGEIKLESEVGKGSTFTLVLDAESPLQEAS